MIPSRDAATSWPPLGLKATSVMTSGPHVSSLRSQLVTCRVSYTYTCPSSAPVARCLMQGLRAGLHWCLSSHHQVITWPLSAHLECTLPGLSYLMTHSWPELLRSHILTPSLRAAVMKRSYPASGWDTALLPWVMNYKCLSSYQIWKAFDLTSFCRMECVERE